MTKPIMSVFERSLSLWVTLCIVVGIALGYIMPRLFAVIASAEVARVNLVVALYIVVPVIVAQIIRNALLSSDGQPALDRLLARLGPVSLIALLTTLVQPWRPLTG